MTLQSPLQSPLPMTHEKGQSEGCQSPLPMTPPYSLSLLTTHYSLGRHLHHEGHQCARERLATIAAGLHPRDRHEMMSAARQVAS